LHYKDKNLQIDIRCHTVFMNDQKIELSLKEFTVLKYLTEHPGWVFSHEEIYRNVWKEEPIDCANAVMCCISQLRKKLKVDSRNWNYIRTVRGVGYKFQPQIHLHPYLPQFPCDRTLPNNHSVSSSFFASLSTICFTIST
jgi:DNA-binding response OmpR family regulator